MADAFRRLFTRLVTFGEGQEDTRRIVDRGNSAMRSGRWRSGLADEDNRLVVTNAPSLRARPSRSFMRR